MYITTNRRKECAMFFRRWVLLLPVMSLLFCNNPTEDRKQPQFDSPVLISPGNGTTLPQSAIVFRWNAVADANNRYYIQISTDSLGPASVIFANTIFTDTTTTISTLFRYSAYYWRVGYESNPDTYGGPTIVYPAIWSSYSGFTLIDTSIDINFRDPQPGQRTEWQNEVDYGYAWKPEFKIGILIVRCTKDTIFLKQYSESGAYIWDVVDSNAFIIIDSSGAFYSGSLFPFTLFAKPNIVIPGLLTINNPGLERGFQTQDSVLSIWSLYASARFEFNQQGNIVQINSHFIEDPREHRYRLIPTGSYDTVQ
jgi:hypothetical protein